jgi:hypothetical protein
LVRIKWIQKCVPRCRFNSGNILDAISPFNSPSDTFQLDNRTPIRHVRQMSVIVGAYCITSTDTSNLLKIFPVKTKDSAGPVAPTEMGPKYFCKLNARREGVPLK